MRRVSQYEDVEFVVEAELQRLEQVEVEAKGTFGRVEGLEDEELADCAELERWVVEGQWPWWFKSLKKDRDGDEPRT